jgi:hypothetical protein
VKLSEPQERHLRELFTAGRYATWRPRHGGEKRCAERLLDHGLVARGNGYGMGTFYTLTEYGRRIAGELS